MFDIGWTEMLMIAVVVVVIVGPRDLPKVLRTTGRWVSNARSVARDFHRSLDQIAEDAELQDIKRELETATNLEIKKPVSESGTNTYHPPINSENSKGNITEETPPSMSSVSGVAPRTQLENGDEKSKTQDESEIKQKPGA